MKSPTPRSGVLHAGKHRADGEPKSGENVSIESGAQKAQNEFDRIVISLPPPARRTTTTTFVSTMGLNEAAARRSEE
ncbi:hypothetical protein PXH66_18765 [Synoicihabitans lomoniglobus]|uniref:Uncharacterized protein n=1 Tax=Synoicihabitans lomoniglobus TaxID=2909285 RepID=A0AAF0CNG1_9BACT|nr:hypothetical protein PXH66_18765 [Opitutaceae bacterium LMO-M01]